MRPALLALLALGACNKDKDGDSGSGDTAPIGTDDSTDTNVTPDCTTSILSVTPEDGDSDVYYRQVFTVSFEGDGSEATFAVTDDAGDPAAISDIVWSDGNVQAMFRVDLEPNTAYHLAVTVCDETSTSVFATNEIGTPLTDGNASLAGRTYVTRLSDATVVDPAVLDVLLSQYLTVPLLFEVTAADESSIDLLGALGYQEDDGSYTQEDGLPTWDFPAGDFTDSPYFFAEADAITIMYGDIPIPIEDFTLEGSFTSDGSQITYGRATGKADSRFLGVLVNQPDVESAVCDLAGTLGVVCEPCADGEPYCLHIIAEDIQAYYEAGLDVEEVLP
jgi:hypothetical protein